MSSDPPIPTAIVIPFAACTSGNRFTAADRVELLRWQAQEAHEVRLAIHRRLESDPPEVGEFASIYPRGGPWAAWGAVRQGRDISIWRSRDGRDIGRFPTMTEALAAVSGRAELQPRR